MDMDSPPPTTTVPVIPPLLTTQEGSIPGGEDAPTESHAIAAAPVEDHPESHGAIHDVAAAAAGTDEDEVKDLGWNEKPEAVPSPLIGGLENEQLWTLVRRFNKVRLPLVELFKKGSG